MAKALTDLAQVSEFLRTVKYRECVTIRSGDPDCLDQETHYLNLAALASDPEAALAAGDLHVAGSGWEQLEAVAAWAREPDFDADLRAVVAADGERGLRDVLLALPRINTIHFYVAGGWPLRVIEELFDGTVLPRRESYVCLPSDLVPDQPHPEVAELAAGDYQMISDTWSRDVWDEAIGYGYRIFAWIEEGQAREFCFHWPAYPKAEYHAVHGLQGVRDWTGPQARAVVSAATAAVHALGKTPVCPVNLSNNVEYIRTFVDAGYRIFHRVHSFLGVKRGGAHVTAPDPNTFYLGRRARADRPEAHLGEGRSATKGDPLIRTLRDLSSPEGRREQELFWVEGETLVERALQDGLPVRCLLYGASLLSTVGGLDLLAKARAVGVEHVRVSDGIMGTLTAARPMPAVLAAVAMRLRPVTELVTSPRSVLLVTDDLQNPSNLGMAIRTADAAGAEAVVVSGDLADPLHRLCVRAARGAVGRFPIFTCDDLPSWLHDLREGSFGVVGAGVHAPNVLYKTPLLPPIAAVVGNESEGLRAGVLELCSTTVAIPMAPGQDSLNVGVAAGILLYELVRRRLEREASLSRW